MRLKDFPSVTKRRAFLATEIGHDLTHIGSFTLDETRASSQHCENMIGATQIPLGVAGPVAVTGEFAQGDFYLPLATTEGALIASVSRGCKAVSQSGGAQVFVSKAGQTRGPVFEAKNQQQLQKCTRWIQDNIHSLQTIASGTSKHLTLTTTVVRSVGRYIFVRFSFDTDDAMGMNMVTIATEALAQKITEETEVSLVSVAGNYDIDKKPAWLNFVGERGYSVHAEVILNSEIINNVLKTTAQKFFDVWLAKCMIGSAMSGSLGFNAHFANVIAALFLATGQDPAHVVEGSMGITNARVLANEALYVSVYLPAVLVGTVGGGTSLATQKEALALLRCETAGSTNKLAEIVGAAVLAGEISLLSSLSEGTLGKAHLTHARANKGEQQ